MSVLSGIHSLGIAKPRTLEKSCLLGMFTPLSLKPTAPSSAQNRDPWLLFIHCSLCKMHQNFPKEGNEILLVLKQEDELSVLRSLVVTPLS